MNEDMKIGAIIALQGVKEEVDTIVAEMKNKGVEEPKGFSVLKGYIDEIIKDYEIGE